MVFRRVLVEGREIHLGALTFIADDFAWLQEAPLDADALPVHGATHFRASVRGILLRQPSTQYWSALRARQERRSPPPSRSRTPLFLVLLGGGKEGGEGEGKGGAAYPASPLSLH